MNLAPFHLAFTVHDLDAAREFYGDLLDCPEGRSSAKWVDFDFRGHQIVAHLAPRQGEDPTTKVDQHEVPARHFGLVLAWDDWSALVQRLRNKDVEFLIEPSTRFEGEPGEQATFFIRDPSGNALEFKAFRDMTALFAQ